MSTRPAAEPGRWEVGLSFRDVDDDTRRSLNHFLDLRIAEFWNQLGQL